MDRKLLLILVLPLFLSCKAEDDWESSFSELEEQFNSQQEKIKELLESNQVVGVKYGKNSYIIKFSDGQIIAISNNQTILVNIGDTKNWLINSNDTGVSAVDYVDNEANESLPLIIIGDNGNWFIDGKDTQIKAEVVGGNSLEYPYIISISEDGNKVVFNFSDGTQKTCSKVLGVSSDRFKGTVRTNETKSLATNYIRKNTFISCNIDFSAGFSSFSLGRGLNDYRGYYINVDDKDVKVYERGTSDYTLRNTYTHNLTLEGIVTVTIDYNDGNSALLSIHTSGSSYKQSIIWWAGGATYIRNDGSKDFYAEVGFQAKDASKPIWIIGDSYISWLNTERWPYYIYQSGFKNWLADHIPGGNSTTMLESFKKSLEFGTPVYAVWCMGMNDKSDMDVVDNIWKEKIEAFIQICESKGIIPILSTIPSVPERDHHLKAKWVRESGYRYIDFSKSVTENDGKSWIEGTLSTDEVHPTSRGALLLSNQVLIDFPEITMN